MVRDSVSNFRRQRFAELLAHPEFAGNQAALGRALGWKNGALVYQILDGRRPLTEKLVEKVETMHGGKFAGWFSRSHIDESDREASAMNVVSAGWPLGTLITPERWASLDQRTRDAAVAAAEQAILESLLGDRGASGKQRLGGMQ